MIDQANAQLQSAYGCDRCIRQTIHISKHLADCENARSFYGFLLPQYKR